MTTIPAHLLTQRPSARPVLPPANTRTPADAEAWLSEVAVGLGDGYYLIWHYSTGRSRLVGFDAYKTSTGLDLYQTDGSATVISIRTGDVHAKQETE